MPTSPTHLLFTDLDASEPDFPARCLAMTDQMLSEMNATIALTKVTIAESRVVMAKADRILAWK
jgi:hypothetical protein